MIECGVLDTGVTWGYTVKNGLTGATVAARSTAGIAEIPLVQRGLYILTAVFASPTYAINVPYIIQFDDSATVPLRTAQAEITFIRED